MDERDDYCVMVDTTILSQSLQQAMHKCDHILPR